MVTRFVVMPLLGLSVERIPCVTLQQMYASAPSRNSTLTFGLARTSSFIKLSRGTQSLLNRCTPPRKRTVLTGAQGNTATEWVPFVCTRDAPSRNSTSVSLVVLNLEKWMKS